MLPSQVPLPQAMLLDASFIQRTDLTLPWFTWKPLFAHSLIHSPLHSVNIYSVDMPGSGLWSHKDDRWTWRGYTPMNGGHLHRITVQLFVLSRKVLQEWKRNTLSVWDGGSRGGFAKAVTFELHLDGWEEFGGKSRRVCGGTGRGCAGSWQSMRKRRSELVALSMAGSFGDLGHGPARLSWSH